MQYQEFLGKVQDHLQSAPYIAAGATAATLTTLGERLDEEEAEAIAAQLPEELQGQILRNRTRTLQEFSLDEFFHRVAQREGNPLEEAKDHAKVVMQVLAEAVSTGELEDVRSKLPAEFAPLLP